MVAQGGQLVSWELRGDGSLWAKAARTGFEMEQGHVQGNVKRKELVLFSTRRPFCSEDPWFLERSSGRASGSRRGAWRDTPCLWVKLGPLGSSGP